MRNLYIIFILVVAGCATQYVPIAAPLDCPEPLILEKATPEIKAQINEMKQNNKPLYEFFYFRSKENKAQRAMLMKICLSTHE